MAEPQKHDAERKHGNHKRPHDMIPFIGNVQEKRIHGDGKQMVDASGDGEWCMGMGTAKEYCVSFWGDGNDLELRRGGGCTTLNECAKRH